MNKLSELSIIQKFSNELCLKIQRKVIKGLQVMDYACLSGDDSILENTWDEICVQVQYQESYAWSTYQLTVDSFIEAFVDELKAYEKEAIWYQTDESIDWSCELDEEREDYPVFEGDIVKFIASDYVYPEANRWSNTRIKKYIESQYY